MMKSKTLIAVLFLMVLSRVASAQLFDAGAGAIETFNGLTSDIYGNVYYGGQEANPGTQWLLRKYDASGAVVWENMDGSGASNCKIMDIVVDGNGDIYASALVSNGSTINGSVVTTLGASDFFLVKINNQGVYQWSQQISSNGGFDATFGVFINSAGNPVIAGQYTTAMNIGVSTLSTSGTHPFWATFNTSGSVLSLNEYAVQSFTSWTAAIDLNDNMYFGSYLSPYQTVLKINPSGTLIWSWATGGGNSEIWGLAVDQNGFVYATGEFDGTMSFDGVPYSSVSMYDDIFVVRLTPGGVFEWVQVFGGQTWDDGYAITCNNTGDCFVTGFFEGVCDFDALSVSSISARDIFFCKLDSLSNVKWVIRGGGNNLDIGLKIQYNQATGLIYSGGYGDNGSSSTFGSLNFTNDYGWWVAIMDNACNATGNVFRDINGNGTLDGGEPGFANRIVEMTPGNFYANSGPGGDYALYSNVGNYNIDLPNVPLYYTLTGVTTNTASFVALGEIDSLNDFALAPTPGMNDLIVGMVATNYGARSGMGEIYHLTYENIGTTSISNAQVTLKFENGLLFNVAVPAQNNFNGSDSLTWNVGTLAPGDHGFIVVIMNIPTSFAIGYPLEFNAYVQPMAGDQTPGDNHLVFTHVVVNSWDPNEKRVFPEGDISPADITAGQWMTYTIRFQNTGSDTAYFVRLLDTISSNLDLGTFEWLAESHPSHWTITNGRKLTVDFNQINLPDSSTDELMSHGFFQYRVKPLGTLVHGDQIENTAYIYFDFNDAIATNVVVTNVFDPNGINGGSPLDVFRIYPNPAAQQVNISIIDVNSITTSELSLIDLQGKVVKHTLLEKGTTIVNLEGIAPGMYLYQITNSGGAVLQNGKLICE